MCKQCDDLLNFVLLRIAHLEKQRRIKQQEIQCWLIVAKKLNDDDLLERINRLKQKHN